MSLANPLSLRARLLLGSSALLLAVGITARLVASGLGGETDGAPPPPSEATLVKGPDGQPVLQLAPGQATALDLKTAPAQESPASGTVVLHGVVLDPLPLLDLDARRRATASTLQAARTAEAAAQAELTRIRALHAVERDASDKALQEAQGAAAAATAQRLAAEVEAGRAQAAWAQVGLRDTAGLANFHRVVVRLDLPLGQPAPSPLPRRLMATVPGMIDPVSLEVIGLAPGGSPLTGGLGLLATAPGQGLRPGLPVDATLAGPAVPRVQVARTSVLWSGEQARVFVALTPDRFVPRPVAVAFETGPSVVLAGGLGRGERVVVQGTLALQGEYARLREGSAIGAGGV